MHQLLLANQCSHFCLSSTYFIVYTGKCKQGPVARVRVGRAKPDLLTHAAADDGGAIAHFIQQQQRLQQLQQAVEQQDLASVF